MSKNTEEFVLSSSKSPEDYRMFELATQRVSRNMSAGNGIDVHYKIEVNADGVKVTMFFMKNIYFGKDWAKKLFKEYVKILKPFFSKDGIG